MQTMSLGVFQMFGSPSARGATGWRHPRSDLARFHELDYWVGLAQLMDRSGMDFLFLADSYGYPSKDGTILDAAARHGLNLPMLDPVVLLPVLAHATQRLGLVVTETTGLHHPIETARRFATLDHLTSGRLGMNVVTGSIQDVVAQLFGHGTMRAHDDRYDMADEYLALVERYWHESWDDGALVADKESGVYLDPAKVHRIEHAGTHYASSGYLMVDPSPQRSPVIFQAGSSGRGRRFAAEHAECVLVQGSDLATVAANIADVREQVVAAGRDPGAVRFLMTLSVVVDPDAAAAQALSEEFDALQTDEVTAAMYLANTGIDLMALDPDLPLSQVRREGVVGQIGQSNIDRFTHDDAPTVREILAQLRGRGVRGLRLVGSPAEVADGIEHVLDVTGLDGILLDPLFGTADVTDFAEQVIPELVRRGRRPQTPPTGTLRSQLFGRATVAAR